MQQKLRIVIMINLNYRLSMYVYVCLCVFNCTCICLAFRNGWIKAENVIPELKDADMIQNILQTLKKRKFEYIIDALYMAKKKWDFNKEEASEPCGVFDESVLNEENLVDDERAEELYRAGVEYMKCAVRFYSEKYADKFVYLPFNQVMNIHRINSAVYDLATSETLGHIAASLLLHNTVRLYQTALFLKDETSINIQTEWHRDLTMVPLDTREGGSLTFWCPLLRTLSHTNNDSMLRFIAGSHRDLSREHWYGSDYAESTTYSQAHSLDVGDCTIHHGWVKHYAPPQTKENSRLAIGFTYVIGDATVLNDFPADTSNRYTSFKDEDEYSYRDWIQDLKGGDVIDHPLLPVVFNKRIVQPQKAMYQKREFEEDIPDIYLYESFV